MIKKIFILIFFYLIFFTANIAVAIPDSFSNTGNSVYHTNSETYNTKKIIPKGSFFRGIMGQTVSSEFNNNDDIVKILIISDFILNNEIIIPKNAFFIANVSNLSSAVQGRNGFFSLDIKEIVFPDDTTLVAKGYVAASKNGKVFGGEFSRRSGHKTVVHRSECFYGTSANAKRGILQLMQNGPRIMGQETKIKAGEVVTIILDEEIVLKE